MGAIAGPSIETGAAVIPAVPSGAAAVTEAAPEGISAPIEAGAVPSVVVEAVVPAAKDELSLLDVIRRDESRIDGEGVGRRKRTEHRERKRCRCC